MDGSKHEEQPDIDINRPDFFEKVQSEIEFDIARIKKTLEIIKKLRLTAAEVEVDTAALHHDELFYYIEELKCVTGNLNEVKNIEDEDASEKNDIEVLQ